MLILFFRKPITTIFEVKLQSIYFLTLSKSYHLTLQYITAKAPSQNSSLFRHIQNKLKRKTKNRYRLASLSCALRETNEK